MKILIIQENGRSKDNAHLFLCHPMTYWLSEAGAETVCWGPGHDTYSTKFKDIVSDCDVILSMENYDTGWHPDLSPYKNILKLFWSIDSHCVLNEHIDFCRKNKIDFHLNSTEGYLPHFDFCDRKMWFPNAVDTRYYKNLDLERNIPLGFCGSLISDREHWLKFIKQYYTVSVDRIVGDEMINLLNSYSVSLNKTIADDLNYRIFENLACATPLITNYVPGLEKLFDLDNDLMIYNNGKELIGAIKLLLDNENLRNTIARNGYNKVMEKHTFKHRCDFLYKELLHIC